MTPSLPNEILRYIISDVTAETGTYLNPPYGPQTLATLCRVSRKFLDLAQPHLYRTVPILFYADEPGEHQRDSDEERGSDSDDEEPFYGDDDVWSSLAPMSIKLSEQTQKLYRSLCNSYLLRNSVEGLAIHYGCNAFAHGDVPQATIKRFMAKCPDLRRLAITADFEQVGVEQGEAVFAALAREPSAAMLSLDEVDIPFTGPKCLRFLFRAPNLRSIILRSISDQDEETEIAMEAQPAFVTAALTSLVIKTRYIGGGVPRGLIAGSERSLQHLTILDEVLDRAPTLLTYLRVLRSLEVKITYSQPIKALALTISKVRSLESLSIIHDSWDDDRLPPSFLAHLSAPIATLNLTNSYFDPDDFTKYIARSTGRLRRLITGSREWQNEKEREETDAAVKAAGVEWSVVKAQHGNYYW